MVVVGFMHLIAGNLVIGFLEGALFARLTKSSYGASILGFIVANYLSAWLGVIWLFEPGGSFWTSVTIENLCWMVGIQIGVSFLLTLAVEFPFAWFAARWGGKGIGLSARVVWSHCKVQAASYLILFFGYWAVSDTSALWATVVSPEELLPSGLRIIYIGPEGRAVHEMNSSTHATKRISEIPEASNRHTLLFRQGTEGWSVVVSHPAGLNDHYTVKVVVSGIPTEKCPVRSSGYPLVQPQNPWDPAVQFGSDQGEWHYYGDVWGRGLTAQRFSGGGEELVQARRLAFSYPLLGWVTHEVTRLPNEMALFRFGSNQICIYDPDTNQVALVAKGRSVVVVRE